MHKDKIKIVTDGMTLPENYFRNLNINFLDQESNVDKDGSIIQIHAKKGILKFIILEVNGNRNKIN